MFIILLYLMKDYGNVEVFFNNGRQGQVKVDSKLGVNV